ncbi:ABC transporter permease [Siculibacillus lacustris]|uniref:ABC transporter permease n=1 Tax=Siculibacillus lacustris TaxID=1549641 RepID=A0A4Q9VP22_9HYPH|nr:ABC transporter permease [Siculibacillus lacustris]
MPPDQVKVSRSPGYWATVGRRILADRVTLVCLVLLATIALAAVFADVLAPLDPLKTSMAKRLRPIGTPGFPLGTDELGRDILSRLLYGGRMSLLMGSWPVANALVIGGTLGIVAGFFGGRLNMVIMRTVDVFYAFPSVLLAVAISGALGSGMKNAIVALTIVFVPPLVRIAETVTTQVRNLDFVEAARASGAGSPTIIRVHLLPNVMGAIVVYASGLFSVSIILASGLSFLGLGVEPPQAEWGLMLNTLRQAIYVQPWVAILPGMMIFVTSICCNLASDGLRAAMEIKQ